MKKLQMIAVLILSLFFVISCVSDDDEFWDEDLTDTMSGDNSGGNADTSTDTLPDNQQADTGTTDNDTTPAPDNDTTPAPDNDTTPAPDNDTETPDSDTTPAPDNDTTPAPDNDTETPDSDTTPAPDNDTETPDSDTTPAQTEEEKCQTAGGTYANNTCTKEADCSGLPENADWNGNGKFTQTLNGTTWTPASKAAAYGEEGECSFKCTGTYLWNTTECVNDPCNPDPCAEITNADSNSCIATDTAFTCTCSGEYHWEIDKCKDNTRTVECTLPAHAHWNDGVETTVVQEWNEGWTPSEEGVYDPEGTDRCSFSCDDDSHWEEASGKCKLNIPVCAKGSETPCIDPEYGYIWSDVHPNTQTWSKAVEWCSNLEEGGYPKGTWKLPTIDQLRTLVKECSKTKYEEEYGEGTCKVSDPSCLSAYNTACYSSADCSCNADNNGGHSKFGETLLLWSNSSESTDRAWRLLFSNASIASDYKYVSDARARCVYVPEND